MWITCKAVGLLIQSYIALSLFSLLLPSLSSFLKLPVKLSVSLIVQYGLVFWAVGSVAFGGRRERAWVPVVRLTSHWHCLLSSFSLLKTTLYIRRCLGMEHLTPFKNFASKWTWLRRNLIALFSKAHWALIQGWLFLSLSYGLYVDLFWFTGPLSD